MKLRQNSIKQEVTNYSVFHKHIHSIQNKETFPDHWKECVIAPIHKKRDQNYCNIYRGISLL
jgi:hypothetical protein